MAKRKPKTLLLKRRTNKDKPLKPKKPKEKFICHFSHCQKELTNKKILKTHLLIHTPRERNFICSTCNKGFLNKHSLAKHELLHTERKRPFTCTNCKRGFLLKEHLKHHEPTCLKNIEITGASEDHIYQCPTCNRCYKSAGNLRIHKKTHTKREAKFLCSVCGKAFLHKYSRDLHEKTFHKNITTVKKNPFRCRTCGKYLMSQKNLERHKLYHKKDFECNLCKKNFFTEEELKEHENIHTVKSLSEEKAHVCRQCDSKCNTGEELLKHMTTHDDNEKPAEIMKISPDIFSKKTVKSSSKQTQQEKINNQFDCSQCDKQFKSKSSFNLHKIRHEKENQKVTNGSRKPSKNNSKKLHPKGRKIFTCHICDKTFPTEDNLETHARIHLDVEESYLCSECLKIFASRANLNDHIKSVHIEKKKYLCPLCPMKFTAKHIMAKHFLNHRNEEGFSCPHCPKYYENQEDMNWHIIKSHQDIVHKLSYKDEFYYHLRILEEDPKNKGKEEPESIENIESVTQKENCLQECEVIFKHQYAYSGLNDQPLMLWL